MKIPANPTTASHLLRRAAFGGRPDEVQRVVDDGIEASVERLLDRSSAQPLVAPKPAKQFIPYELDTLAGWFLDLCATSPTPAIERLTWFWHGHFATSVEKVELADLMATHVAALRRWSLGRFDDLVLAMVHDAAMNMWLDLHRSVRGNPNENFARELFELFTLGVGNGYTQRDVVEAARAFTGYGFVSDPRYEREIAARLVPTLHDYGAKTILGSTGPFDGADVVELVMERPECHRFVVERLWLRYAGTSITDDVARDLVPVFAARRNIGELLAALLVHPAFYEPDVRQGLVVQPVELAVRTMRGFDLRLPDFTAHTIEELEHSDDWLEGESAASLHPHELLEWLETMGQMPMVPPNVGGWPHNEAWLDSNRAAGRLLAGTQLGHLIVESELPAADDVRRATERGAAELTAELMGRFGRTAWSPETEEAIGAALGNDPGDGGIAAAVAIAFTSPEVTLA